MKGRIIQNKWIIWETSINDSIKLLSRQTATGGPRDSLQAFPDWIYFVFYFPFNDSPQPPLLIYRPFLRITGD